MSTMAVTKQGRRPRRQFDDDFRAQAVRLVLDEGKTVGAAARDLDLTPSVLRRWVEQARADRTLGRTGLTTAERGPAPHDFFGQPSARRRMSYVQGKTARGWGLGGRQEGDRRGLSLVVARRHGAVVRATKVSVVIEVLKGESLESLSRRHGVTAAKLSQWRDDFVAGGEARLKHREVTVEGADTRRLKSVVADLATDKALLAEKIRHLEAGRPLGWWRSKR